MRDLAANQPPAQKFDAVIIDEAQDFADAWWPAVLASLRDEEAGGLYVFSDEGQRVFARYGQPPVPLVPLMLDHNLRNTRQIAGTFNSLAPMKMRLFGGDGPAVSQDEYWASFWDTEQVFYGHVLGFKGLERRAVVLVLNETTIGDRSRERLYVGLSRARDQLVVCGRTAVIRQLGGEDVLRHIRGDSAIWPTPRGGSAKWSPPGRAMTSRMR